MIKRAGKQERSLRQVCACGMIVVMVLNITSEFMAGGGWREVGAKWQECSRWQECSKWQTANCRQQTA